MKNEIAGYLISEQTTASVPTIIKNTKNNNIDNVTIDAELQDCAEFNRNTRNYPRKPLNEGLNHPNIKELISHKSWVGEAGHPLQPTVQRQLSIDHSNISHRINSWRWEGNKIMGEVETLMTNRGKEMRDLIRQLLEVAFSLRAVGPVEKTSRGLVVQSPLTIVTYDWVFIPSHRGSYMKSIKNDSLNNQSALSESYCVPINALGECIDYIGNESYNLKLITESLEYSYDNIILSNDLKSVKILSESSNESIIVNIEDYISADITNYMSKLKK